MSFNQPLFVCKEDPDVLARYLVARRKRVLRDFEAVIVEKTGDPSGNLLSSTTAPLSGGTALRASIRRMGNRQ
jgi:hypothetical protein